MSSESAQNGVCAACRYDPDCIYEALAEGAVLQCEQFEIAFREPVAGEIECQADASPSNEEAASPYLGLCSNCDNRAHCIYPKPEGGVWRCEEYA